MFPAGLLAIAADVSGIVFISFSGITVLDHIARAGIVWLLASLLMVFVFPAHPDELSARAGAQGDRGRD